MDSKTLSLLAARKFRNHSGIDGIPENAGKNQRVSRFVDAAARLL
jgi:hypothetical protein